ncbi:MAG: molybdopterin-dependent oxidoreductase [Glaciecola sp.]
MSITGKHWKQTEHNTTCPYCGVGCGVSVQCDTTSSTDASGNTLEEKQNLHTLTGNAAHPANAGKLCVKGSHLLDTTDTHDKLLYPSINGKRSSWTGTLDKMAAHIQHCIEHFGPDSVAFYLSGQLLTEDYYVANKLMKGFLGSANVDTNSRLCMSSAVAAYKRAFGADAVPCCYEDLEHTDLLVLTGSNAAWTHPVLFQRMQKAIAQHSERKMVVIDPRKTATSKAADLHLAIKPGTDTWVFNGLLHYLVSNQLCDYAYIQAHTNDFEACCEAIENYTLSAVSEATELLPSELEQFYQMFASADSAISFYSMGINQSSSGVDKANSIINCHLASGKIGKIGSGPFSITGQPNAMGGREVGGLANMLAAHMDIENAEHNALVQSFWQAPNMATKNGLKAVDMFDSMAAGNIKFVWIMGTNPVVSMPNRVLVEEALSRCDMVVVSDIVTQTDTLAYADIVLPATGWSEKDGTVTNSERCISRQRGILSKQGECKHDWEIISKLAQKLGFADAFNYQSAADIFDEHARLSAYKNKGTRDFDLSALVGLSRSEYNTLTPAQWPVNKQHPNGKKRLFEDGKFYTKNGRANFIAIRAKFPQQLCNERYPLVLNTGRMRDQWHTMTRTGKAKALIEHTPQAEVHMSTADAKKYAVNTGDLLALSSKHNIGQAVIAPVLVTDDQRKGALFAPIHWSLRHSSHYALARLFSSANDPVSGQPELKHAAVSVQKVSPSESLVLALPKQTLALDIHQLTTFAPYVVSVNQGEYAVFYLSRFETVHYSASLIEMVSAYLQKSINVSWLSKIDTHNAQASKLAFTNNDENTPTLLAYMVGLTREFTGPLANIINPEFMRECFDTSDLTQHQQQYLLNVTSPPEYQQGKLICSCFKVRKHTIQDAILAGMNTIEALGDKLKCGTNCGSCKSELNSLISEHTITQSSSSLPRKTPHRIDDNQQIPIEVIK